MMRHDSRSMRFRFGIIADDRREAVAAREHTYGTVAERCVWTAVQFAKGRDAAFPRNHAEANSATCVESVIAELPINTTRARRAHLRSGAIDAARFNGRRVSTPLANHLSSRVREGSASRSSASLVKCSAIRRKRSRFSIEELVAARRRHSSARSRQRSTRFHASNIGHLLHIKERRCWISAKISSETKSPPDPLLFLASLSHLCEFLCPPITRPRYSNRESPGSASPSGMTWRLACPAANALEP